MSKQLCVILLLPILLFVLSCDRRNNISNPNMSGPPTFTEIANVMNNNCAFSGCHGSVAPNPIGRPMVLALGQSYQNIVNVPSTQIPQLLRVNPGLPDSSYLYMKLIGVPGIQGVRMPPGGNSNITPQVIDRFRQWIANGALNN